MPNVPAHTHPVSALQIFLIIVQVLIAAVSLYISRKYYKGVESRGGESLETQKAELYLKYQSDNEIKLKTAIELCDRIYGAALEGTKTDRRLPDGRLFSGATDGLHKAKGDLIAMQKTMTGLPEQRLLESGIKELLELIDLYLNGQGSSDAQDHRVTTCAKIKESTESFENIWKKITDSRLSSLTQGAITTK